MLWSSAQIPGKPVVPGCGSWSIPDGLVLVKEDKLGQAVPFLTSASGPYIPQLVTSGHLCLCLPGVCVCVCVVYSAHTHTHTNMRKRENKYEFEYRRCVHLMSVSSAFLNFRFVCTSFVTVVVSGIVFLL